MIREIWWIICRNQQYLKRESVVRLPMTNQLSWWQLQKTVSPLKSELNRCLSDLLGEKVGVIEASRTDAEVHALGNIAVFATTRMPAEENFLCVESEASEDIRIQKSLGGARSLASEKMLQQKNL